MLYIFIAGLCVLWLMGVVSSAIMSGLIHALLIIAIVVVLLKLMRGPTST